MLEWSQPRNHRDDGIAYCLCPSVGSSHDFGKEISRVNHLPDHGAALRRIAFKQLLVALAVQCKVKFPCQIPHIVKPGVHALSAERAVNVSGVSGNEHPPDAQLRYLAMMDAEVAAPVQLQRLNA